MDCVILITNLFYNKEFNLDLKFYFFIYLWFNTICSFLYLSIFQYNIFSDDVFKLLFFDEEFHISADHDLRFLDLKSRIILAFDKFPKHILYRIITLFNFY